MKISVTDEKETKDVYVDVVNFEQQNVEVKDAGNTKTKTVPMDSMLDIKGKITTALNAGEQVKAEKLNLKVVLTSGKNIEILSADDLRKVVDFRWENGVYNGVCMMPCTLDWTGDVMAQIETAATKSGVIEGP